MYGLAYQSHLHYVVSIYRTDMIHPVFIPIYTSPYINCKNKKKHIKSAQAAKLSLCFEHPQSTPCIESIQFSRCLVNIHIKMYIHTCTYIDRLTLILLSHWNSLDISTTVTGRAPLPADTSRQPINNKIAHVRLSLSVHLVALTTGENGLGFPSILVPLLSLKKLYS